MPWNTILFDSAGKIKDARVSGPTTLTASGTPLIDLTTSFGFINGFPIKSRPGHYKHTQGNHAAESEDIDDWTFELINEDFPPCLDSPELLGCTARLGWGDLEPTEGNYDFHGLEDILAWHSQRNKILLLQPLWKFFNGQEDDLGSNKYNRICPSDLVTAGHVNATQSGGIAKIWLPVVMDAFLAFWDELATQFGDESNLEWVFTTETPTSMGPLAPGDYSNTGYGAQLDRLIDQCAASFTKTNASVTINSLGSGEGARLMEYQYQSNLPTSTPDARTTTGERIFRGDAADPPGSGSGDAVRDYRTLMGHLSIVSGSSMDEWSDAGDQGQYADDQKMSHLAWIKTNAASDPGFDWFDDVIPYIESEAATYAGSPLFVTCPPNYPFGCFVPELIRTPMHIARKDGITDPDNPSVPVSTTIASIIGSTPLAGDIIELQAATGGGSETWVEAMTFVDDGTEGDEIILRGRTGDANQVYVVDAYTANFDPADYWIIQNLELGNADDSWLQADAGRSVDSVRNINIDTNSHHIDFQDCMIWGGSGSSKGGFTGNGQCNKTNNGSHHIRFLRCTLDLAGSNNDPEQTSPVGDRGDLMRSESLRTLFVDCTFMHGGHQLLEIDGAWSVVRNCTFDGSWIGQGTSFDGQRCIAVSSGGDNGNSPWGEMLLEDNIFKNAAGSVDETDKQVMAKLEGRGIIFRGNYGWDNQAETLSGANNTGGFSTDNTIKYHRVYNNTFYVSGSMLRFLDQQNVLNWDDMHFKYNIWDQMTSVGQQNGDHVHWDTRGVPSQGNPDNWEGAIFDGNIVKDDSIAISIFLRTSAPVPPPNDSLTDAESTYPLVWMNNDETAVTWDDAGARTKVGFTISSGTGLADAGAMTQISNSVTSATLTLDDARWIYAGADPGSWDLSYFGEIGDYIKVNSDTVQVLTINYDTGVITVDSVITVTAGDNVFRVGADGTTLWNNRGATQ